MAFETVTGYCWPQSAGAGDNVALHLSSAGGRDVQVEVDVGPSGRTATTRVVAEQPRGEGFGGAARACAAQLRFSPAQTSQGTLVEGHARLLLSFDRS